jgi:beta-glucosidase/6-phospho-beta-glucosidase/beta-galactosidase
MPCDDWKLNQEAICLRWVEMRQQKCADMVKKWHYDLNEEKKACTSWICVCLTFAKGAFYFGGRWIETDLCIAWTWAVRSTWAAGIVLSCGICRAIKKEELPKVPPLSDLPEFPKEVKWGGRNRPFLWGVATASCQVEGQSRDPKGNIMKLNDWDFFTMSGPIRERVRNLGIEARDLGGIHSPIFELEPPGRAVDHLDMNVFSEDLNRAKLLGMNAYRFSLEWSRIQPAKKEWINNRPDWINQSQEARNRAEEYRNKANEFQENGTSDKAKEYLMKASAEIDRALSLENAPPNADDFNKDAMKRYLEMVKKMIEMGLTPVVTLNHMSLPWWVSTPPEASLLGLPIPDDGFKDSLRGWEEEITIKAFEKYTHYVLEFEDDNRKKFKDYIEYWITINEPVGTMVGVGYLGGSFPPGFVGDKNRAEKALFNLMRAHVRAYDKIKELAGENAQVGFAHAMGYQKVAKGNALWSGAGIGAAAGAIIGVIIGGIPWLIAGAAAGGIAGGILGANKLVNIEARNQYDYFLNWHFLDSVTGRDGKKLVDVKIDHRPNMREYQSSEEFFGIPIDKWKPKVDFIAPQYYDSTYIFFNPGVTAVTPFVGGAFYPDLRGTDQPHNMVNDLGWEIYPGGYYLILKRLHESYGLPILITENGIAEKIDRNRAPFIVSHLQHVLLAMKEGVRIAGYIHWTLMDNWEWAYDYSPDARFGLFSVDRGTGEESYPRHITEGALALQYIITKNGIGQSIEKFSTFTSKGDRVEPSTMTAGATWEGIYDETYGFTLYLNRLKNDMNDAQHPGFLGMIFYHDLRKWVILENIFWDEGQKKLKFSHGAGFSYETNTNLSKRNYEGIATTDGSLNGTFMEDNIRHEWNANKLIPYGLWNSSLAPHLKLYLNMMEGEFSGWKGKVFYEDVTRSWQALDDIEWDGTTLKFSFPGVSFSGVIDRDSMKGRIKYQKQRAGSNYDRNEEVETEWEAKKSSDDIPF